MPTPTRQKSHNYRPGALQLSCSELARRVAEADDSPLMLAAWQAIDDPP